MSGPRIGPFVVIGAAGFVVQMTVAAALLAAVRPERFAVGTLG